MKKGGQFVISLDFELMWGMFDKVTVEQYGERISGVHDIVPRLLTLFAEENIHATWATVGMLMCNSKSELLKFLPEESLLPQYKKTKLSSFQHLHSTKIEEADKNYFAPSLVQKIIDTEGQELASHTFSHFYCLENQMNSGSNATSFTADCRTFNEVAKQYGVEPKSIVFPRNQWSKEALKIIFDNKIICYRGTESHFMYKARTDETQRNLFLRALRLIDQYINLSGFNTYKIKTHDGQEPLNLPASRFLRPYSPKLAVLEPLRLRRIKRAMTHAAKNGAVYHLWWHPHNFGMNQKQNLAFLKKILAHYKKLEHKYGMESRNMGEVATSAFESSDEVK